MMMMMNPDDHFKTNDEDDNNNSTTAAADADDCRFPTRTTRRSQRQISRQLFRPDPRVASIEKNVVPIDKTVSSFPYLEVLSSHDDGTTTTGGGDWSTTTATADDQNANEKKHNNNNDDDDQDHYCDQNNNQNTVVLPSYLDLRRRQNLDYVRSCRDKASQLTERWRSLTPGTLQYGNELEKIETELGKALELIPDDVESLLLYSQILLEHDINSSSSLSTKNNHSIPRKDLKIIEKMVKKVLKIDPRNSRADDILEEVERRRKRLIAASAASNSSTLPMHILSLSNKHGKVPPSSSSTSSIKLTARDSSAFQDVLMERNLLEGSTGMMMRDSDHETNDDGDDGNGTSSADTDNDNDYNNFSDYDRRKGKRKRSNEKHGKKRKKRKKTRKHDRYDNDDDDDDDDDDKDNDNDDNERRRGKRHKRSKKGKKSKKRKKAKMKKRSERSDDETSSSDSRY